MTIVLGINQSHSATACIYINGDLKAAVQEERLNRVKFQAGFPELSIRKVIEITGINPRDIERVAIGTMCENFDSNLVQEGEYRLTTQLVTYSSLFLPSWLTGSKPLTSLYRLVAGRGVMGEFYKEHTRFFEDLGIPRDRLIFYDHHTCHAAAAYFCSNSRDKTLVITCDGNGDGLCASVSIAEGNRIERRIGITSINSLGGLYARFTKFLGMAPWQDEYKVMGMAPWGATRQGKRSVKGEWVREEMHKIWEVHGLSFYNKSGYAGDVLIDYLTDKFRNVRFDYLCYGIQAMLEDVLRVWIGNLIEHFGIRRLAMSGGTFLNVKANKHLLDTLPIEEMFIFPASGDDNISIGAGILGSLDLGEKDIKPLRDLYLGEDISRQTEDFIKCLSNDRYEVTKHDDIADVASDLLSKNKVVARCAGRMEFGPRALGNRSLMANPSNLYNIQVLNKMIKCRDFWMPFAGTVLDKYADEYIVNHREAPYMILAFDTKDDHWESIQGATHQADRSIRPQILKREWNPDYYDIIDRFRAKTGLGLILNTSLNLHGEPMVNTVEEAFSVLERSALEYLILEGGYLIRKKQG